MKNILGYLFIALYMCYAVSTSMFIHTHYYEGQRVVHSHPFLMGEGGALNHTHTASQSVFIHHISTTLLLVISSAIGVAVLFITLSKEYHHEIQAATSRFMLYFSLRAPPSCESIL
ncbi:MAG: hypothetical protein J6V54_05725 [Bacteroidales bacterium]|nr:hypothetical protein [Bacteroidales bacterium]